MNVRNIGRKIENTIKIIEKLEDDDGGFDASYNNIPVEIKGCLESHKNGVDYKGRDRVVKGRFWIDNNAHRILLERRGFYIFVIYHMIGMMPIIRRYTYMSVLTIDRQIKSGDNTKIPYDRIFPDYKGRVAL